MVTYEHGVRVEPALAKQLGWAAHRAFFQLPSRGEENTVVTFHGIECVSYPYPRRPHPVRVVVIDTVEWQQMLVMHAAGTFSLAPCMPRCSLP